MDDLRLLDGDEARALGLACASARCCLHRNHRQPRLMLVFAGRLRTRRRMLALCSPVRRVRCAEGGHEVEVAMTMTLRARINVNAAGLPCTRWRWRVGPVARPAPRAADAPVGSSHLPRLGRALPRARASAAERRGLGAPDAGPAGQARFGPDTQWLDTAAAADAVDYRVDPARGDAFYAEVRAVTGAGRRRAAARVLQRRASEAARSRRGGGGLGIQGRPSTGIDGPANLFGIESPGLTMPALADEVPRARRSALFGAEMLARAADPAPVAQRPHRAGTGPVGHLRAAGDPVAEVDVGQLQQPRLLDL